MRKPLFAGAEFGFKKLNRAILNREGFARASQYHARAARYLLLFTFTFLLLPCALAQSPPADRTLVYTAGADGALLSLPFEAGATPLRMDVPASSARVSHIELRGAHAAVVVTTDMPRFYLFVRDEPNPHPPFLVWLTPRRNARRVTAVTSRGQPGFAIASDEIVLPHYRVLARADGMIFMEVRPRLALVEGEYAFIGADLAGVAAFRVAPASIGR